MLFRLLCYWILLSPLTLWACTSDEDENSNPLFDPTYDYTYHDTHIVILDEEQKKRAIAACQGCANYGKSIGIFGGSHSCSASSWMQRYILETHLNATVKTYGVGGQGFATLSGSIQQQVDKAGVHDIYILWCSTNDFNGNREPGYITDYTEADRYNIRRRISQCGGINYCIRALRQKNPNARIYLFGSLKYFKSEAGFNEYSGRTNNIGFTYPQYIQMQAACAQAARIPFFDQYHTIPIDLSNFKMCVMSDLLHYNATGYANIAYQQLEFLATH